MRIKSGTLANRRRSQAYHEDYNPMEGITNLVDVMLIFACGLMVAIILNWNVDLSRVTDVITAEDLVEVQGLEEAVRDGSLMESFDSKGMVYEDPETGKMYIITN